MSEPFRYKPRREKLHVDDPGLLEMITKLAMHLGLSRTHMAEILGVSKTTLYDFLNDHDEAMDAYRAGRAAGRGAAGRRRRPGCSRAGQPRGAHLSRSQHCPFDIEPEVGQVSLNACEP